MPSPKTPRTSPQTPFQITLQRLEETPSGHFQPSALIQITPSLRTSGLLRALPAEELKSLLMVLTFLHPNGHIQPSLLELSQAFHLSEAKTRERMQQLQRFLWQGKLLLYELPRDSGLHAYAPSLHLFAIEQERHTTQSAPKPAYRAASREAVLAHSRALYARPREEVEKEIARLNGWPWPFQSIAETQEQLRKQALSLANAPPNPANSLHEVSTSTPSLNSNPMSTTPTEENMATLRQQLILLGVPYGTADSLLARFEPDRIQRQIEWLPFRKAKSPARLLVAAIEADYEAPLALHPIEDPSQNTAVSPTPEEKSLPLP